MVTKRQSGKGAAEMLDIVKVSGLVARRFIGDRAEKYRSIRD